MVLPQFCGNFVDAAYLHPPSARCGHISVVVDKTNDFGTELIIIHGGINASKSALSDLAALQVSSEEWLALPPSPVGPAARAFHSACVIGPFIYIFGGHVFLPEQKRLVQFNDIWRLCTDTWQWQRLEAEDHEAPCPVARDRAALLALDDTRLLVYGGSDAQGKRLDDMWVFDLESSAWKEVTTTGSQKPRPRTGSTLFLFGSRVMLFGGDTLGGGPTNELWSLRGLIKSTKTDGNHEHLEEEGPPQWTQLHLQGGVPASRRGHACCPAPAAITGGGMLFIGGKTEQKLMLGMKKQSEYLMDLILLQRIGGGLHWRGVDVAGAAAMVISHGLSDLGATGGLGDESGLVLPKGREMHTVSPLKDGRMFLFGGTDGTTTLGDAFWLTLEDIAINSSSNMNAIRAPDVPSVVQGSSATTGNGGGLQWGALPSPSSLLPAAFTSLRGLLPVNAPAAGTIPSNAVHQGTHVAVIGTAVEDEALLALGKMALMESDVDHNAAGAGGHDNKDNLVRAARSYLASCSPRDLKLGLIPTLLHDYRRLAKSGWASIIARHGQEALSKEDVVLPGRFMMLTADEVRLKDVGAILEDYRGLLAAAAGPKT